MACIIGGGENKAKEKQRAGEIPSFSVKVKDKHLGRPWAVKSDDQETVISDEDLR